MHSKHSKLLAAALSAVMLFGAQAAVFPAAAEENTAGMITSEAVETLEGITISSDKISTGNYKDTDYNNPVSSDFFCADPTSVEYNGRLYLIGTNDHEQFEAKGPDVDNTYECIKSMVVLSTDDMVNWTYHGEINIGEIAPWIINSWAPSVVSRVEDDGKTHFYLYFSNNGLGVGVIHATDPTGPWDDPLGEPLISTSTPGLTDCPNPFDPGAVIDDNGVGWLSFGAGKASDGTTYMPGSNRIVRLGEDMVSIDSEFAEIPAPYHFEASELNYINGTYVYTYNTDWSDHTEQWDYDCEVPSACSMVYMTTKTPLDPDSWEMKGEYFKNPGLSGFDYSNNHTHLHKFNDNYYIFYHTLMLKQGMGISGSYRSLNVDTINVDEETVTIEKTGGTKKGVSSIVCVDPFEVNQAAELNNTADISFDTSDAKNPVVISDGEGSWISVRDVEFTESTDTGEEEAPVELELTGVDTIRYDITVTSVDKNTTVSMYPSTKDGGDCAGSVDITGTGKYSITCDMGGSEQLMNLGYFKASDDALITFVVNSITLNDKYEFDISTELTNTREWADGLKNIWNGFSDGDTVYTSDYAELRYIAADDAIELFGAAEIPNGSTNGNAPLLEEPVTFYGKVKGTGRVEVRLDSPTGEVLTSIDFDTPDSYQTVYNSEVAQTGGTHDLYFVFSGADISLASWQFAAENEETVTGDVNADGVLNVADLVSLQKYVLGKETPANYKACDLCEDGCIDSFDIIMMRKALLAQ
ncbi:MAG: family 43 glycosylhydrolase [Ruminococcus sp.]|nr:family 43 glycosylhydrolase [Ruminococcus sp.]